MEALNRAKLQKVIDHYQEELKSLKTGRANSSLLEQIDVQAYGSSMKISGLATVSSQDARTLIISPWDKSVMKDIESAIKNSDLGVNPNVDGDVIRLNFPPLTEERRKELTKILGRITEDTKVGIRNLRRDFITKIENEKKENNLSEGEIKSQVNDVENVIKDFISKIEEIQDIKSKELTVI